MNIINKASEFAKMAHKGQKRKFSGGDYYEEHCKVVAETIINNLNNFRYNSSVQSYEETVAAAYLHDVLEDTEYTLEEFPESIQNIVYDLSRQETETYFDYIMRIRTCSKRVRIIKLADLKCNMKDLQEGSMKDKYRFAQYILDMA